MSINLFKLSHGCCKWAGCDTHCPTIEEFHRHLSRWEQLCVFCLFVCLCVGFLFCFIFDRCFRTHVLDDKSTAQTKVQIQIVEQLEQQLQKVRTNKYTYLQQHKRWKKTYICNSYKRWKQKNVYICNSYKRWTNKTYICNSYNRLKQTNIYIFATATKDEKIMNYLW